MGRIVDVFFCVLFLLPFLMQDHELAGVSEYKNGDGKIERQKRQNRQNDKPFFYGITASGNQTIKIGDS